MAQHRRRQGQPSQPRAYASLLRTVRARACARTLDPRTEYELSSGALEAGVGYNRRMDRTPSSDAPTLPGEGGRTPSAAATSTSRPPPSTTNDDTERVEIQRAALLGAWTWPAFTLLDLYMLLCLYPELPIWPCLFMRAVCQVPFMVSYWCSRQESIPVVVARRTYLLSVDLCAVFISLMAIGFGGLNSVYMHGLSVAILVVAICQPDRGRTAVMKLAPIALAYPVVMAIAASFMPAILDEWGDPRALLVFGSNYIFVLAMMALGTVSSHMVWAARQQVYQARKLGRYRLEAPIGQGGMNQVWLAWDAALARNVALKILRTSGAKQDTLRRFEREARAASQLLSPHTIRIFDFGVSDDGIQYIAMEYLQGADLAALVEAHGPMPAARVVHFGVQACASLQEAHRAGIIHRDVKPHNFFVTSADGDLDFLKLLDFGIARRLEEVDETKLTRTGAVTGTPSFMAPEVIRGEAADERTDIYGLGATLYFILASSPPFVGQSGGVMMAHLLESPEPPSARGTPVPAELERVVLRCLAKDPKERFQTASELAAALRATGCGEWTGEDARLFWQRERAEILERWAQSTSDATRPTYDPIWPQ